ncbi:MAG: class I SAM-dependent methyltransferase [Deltaproteobacteria bacterium]|nr:class I SAM-dependent methyltransferase [Deltaproteobacteria bacterium]MBW2307332.1 class I SAM-dependent methyltransferase [Deltaproteobacteria bacterium]
MVRPLEGNPHTIDNKILQYWESQAQKLGTDPRATTQDFWLRKIEIRVISSILEFLGDHLHVLDVGCGNGYSILELVRAHNTHRFVGVDFSGNMIGNARHAADSLPEDLKKRTEFKQASVLDLAAFKNLFDVVISDRCLINLSCKKEQWRGLCEIRRALKPQGHAIVIENFKRAHENMNKVRNTLGLPAIPIRWHNLYFDEEEFLEMCSQLFEVRKVVPISSTYYLITRIVYSKLCQLEGREPDYDHKVYEVASQLPFVGDFGPIKLHLLKKSHNNY